LTLLRDILALKIVVDRESLAAGEILADPYGSPAKRDALEREGIKRDGDRLLIVPNLVEAHLKHTAWDGQSTKEILVRLPGADAGRDRRCRFAGVRHYPIAIPWKIVDQFLSDDGEEGVTDGF
jgi:hypothetical protein